MTNNLKEASGVEWRDRMTAGVLVRLPSGNLARVRSVQPSVVIRSGRLPDSLTPLIVDVMDGKTDEESWKPKTVAELGDYVAFMDLICECAMVSPRIVADPQSDDEIGIEHLDTEDKEFLVQLMGASTRKLESFRQEQKDDVESLGSAKRTQKARQRNPAPE